MAGSAPDALRETARAALRSAFGPVPIGSLVPLSGGASGAVPFRAEVGGRRYLVRVEGPASPLRNPYQYESLRIAAEAGLAPRLHHVDEAARVAVTDFVAERPLDRFPGGPGALAAALGTLLRRLQETPSFPAFVAYPDLVARLWAHVGRTGLFAAGVLDPCTDHLEALRAMPGWGDAGAVSSHNDPVPRNILFDGERLWLIDWESACRN
ncbi:phosphotransferase, partial [Stella sp.]|uniref:phosphotransferase n=1 Tax=Stella sp. TaxID=2912054 RepID=UPI0035B4CDFE